jgi:hypothetical protein
MARLAIVSLVSSIFVVQLATPVPVMAQTEETPGGNCIACHRLLDDERLSAPTVTFAEDIHAMRGFGCVACHGGDETAPGLGGMDPAKGFLAKPEFTEIPGFCGRCHSDASFMSRYNPALRVDQEIEYATSVHGRRLEQSGDEGVATCASCHPAHSIRPPTDPLSSVNPLNVAQTCATCHADADHMAPYDIPIDQLEKYQSSVHWQMMVEQQDLSAPTCNDCHGNHGAAPPGVSWVGNVCGQCHSVMADMYSQSVHAELFTMMGMPGCATCHQEHDIHEATDEMLGVGEGAVCSMCHQEGVGGGILAAAMRTMIDSLHGAYEAADSLLSQAEFSGMEVSEALFELQGAQTALVLARAAVHTFNVLAVEEEVVDGLAIAANANTQGEELLDELRFRRLGLAISSVIILVLIGGLVLKIRQLDQTEVTT